MVQLRHEVNKIGLDELESTKINLVVRVHNRGLLRVSIQAVDMPNISHITNSFERFQRSHFRSTPFAVKKR